VLDHYLDHSLIIDGETGMRGRGVGVGSRGCRKATFESNKHKAKQEKAITAVTRGLEDDGFSG